MTRPIGSCPGEFSHLAAAMVEANRIGWSLIRRRVRRKRTALRALLDVRDEGNATVGRIRLAELAHQMS
jgi:hypothetical protein